MKNIARHLRSSFAPSLLVLMAGCSSSAVVGTENDPLPQGVCAGSCLAPEYAAPIKAGYSAIQDMAATPDGGVVLVGQFALELDTPDLVLHQSSYSGNDGYLMKRAADGSIQWLKQIKGNLTSAELVVRPSGEIVLVGSFQDKADLGTGDIQSPGKIEMFFTTVAADGTVAPPVLFGLDAFTTDLVQLDDGNLLVTAETDNPGAVLGVTLTGQEAFLLTLSPTGQRLSARGTAGTGVRILTGLSARPGGAAMIGERSGPVQWDGVSIPGAADEAFVLAVDDAGTGVWGSRLDPTPQDAADASTAVAISVAAAPNGRTVVGLTGAAAGEARNIAFQTFDQDGTRLSHVDVGQAMSNPWQLAVTPGGDVLLVGASWGSLTIAGAHNDTASDTDAYAARLSPTGELRWLRTFGAPGSIQQAIHIVTSTEGRPVIGGEYLGTFAIDDEALPLVQQNPNAFIAAFAP